MMNEFGDIKHLTSRPLAVMAKMHGFNESCNNYYDERDKQYMISNINTIIGNSRWNEIYNKIALPTLDELRSWVREHYGIHIVVDTYFNKYNDIKYSFIVFHSKETKINTLINELDRDEDNMIWDFETWYEALSKALFYVFDQYIKIHKLEKIN